MQGKEKIKDQLQEDGMHVCSQKEQPNMQKVNSRYSNQRSKNKNKYLSGVLKEDAKCGT